MLEIWDFGQACSVVVHLLLPDSTSVSSITVVKYALYTCSVWSDFSVYLICFQPPHASGDDQVFRRQGRAIVALCFDPRLGVTLVFLGCTFRKGRTKNQDPTRSRKC